MRHLSLFSGIGGLDLAAEWAGMETVGFVERNEYCQKVLQKNWPGVPIWGDIHEATSREIAKQCGAVDIISGGFPCQPWSCIGRKKGEADARHLWPEMLRIISEIRPAWVVGENVTNFARMGLDNLLTEMESAGYTCQPFIVPAFGVGAKHKRDRLFIVCHSNSEPSNKTSEQAVPICAGGQTRGNNRAVRRSVVPPSNWQKSPSMFLRVADGISSDVDRRRALGNAVVPQQAYPIFKAIMEVEACTNTTGAGP